MKYSSGEHYGQKKGQLYIAAVTKKRMREILEQMQGHTPGASHMRDYWSQQWGTNVPELPRDEEGVWLLQRHADEWERLWPKDKTDERIHKPSMDERMSEDQEKIVEAMRSKSEQHQVKVQPDGTVVEKHPSFGFARLTRTSGGQDNLFGSPTKHQHRICLTIGSAERRRDYNSFRIFPSSIPDIEIEMSDTQFAALLTSMGRGEGVPVTVVRRGLDSIEECPSTETRAIFADEFKAKVGKTVEGIDSLMDEVREILAQKTIKVADKEKLTKLYTDIQRKLTDSIPFMVTQFNKTMDDTVTAAHSELLALCEQSGLIGNLEESGWLPGGNPQKMLGSDASDAADDE